MIDGQMVGKQHYVKWQIQPVAYCLEAWGFIEIPGGENVNFYHRQAWFPPSGPTCSNPYMRGQVCVKQFEVWEDDNPANVPNSYGPGSQPGLNLRSEEHTSELQSREHLVCRLLLVNKKSPDGRRPRAG